MYSLYVLGTLMKHDRRVADFYEELRDEVEDRVADGIAAVGQRALPGDVATPSRRGRFLEVFRYLEEFGCVSVGSLYTFAPDRHLGGQAGRHLGAADHADGAGHRRSRTATRRCALLADWNLSKPEWQHFYSPHLKSEMMIRIAKEWKLDGVMLHYNRGCEGLTVGIAENRLALIEAGFPVMTFEGNMGDEREFDEGRDHGAHRRLHGDARTAAASRRETGQPREGSDA